MPKFSMDINGVDVDAAEERHAWAGELPPNGSYEGILKIVSIGNISQTAKIALADGRFDLAAELARHGTKLDLAKLPSAFGSDVA